MDRFVIEPPKLHVAIDYDALRSPPAKSRYLFDWDGARRHSCIYRFCRVLLAKRVLSLMEEYTDNMGMMVEIYTEGL